MDRLVRMDRLNRALAICGAGAAATGIAFGDTNVDGFAYATLAGMLLSAWLIVPMFVALWSFGAGRNPTASHCRERLLAVPRERVMRRTVPLCLSIGALSTAPLLGAARSSPINLAVALVAVTLPSLLISLVCYLVLKRTLVFEYYQALVREHTGARDDAFHWFAWRPPSYQAFAATCLAILACWVLYLSTTSGNTLKTDDLVFVVALLALAAALGVVARIRRSSAQGELYRSIVVLTRMSSSEVIRRMDLIVDAASNKRIDADKPR